MPDEETAPEFTVTHPDNPRRILFSGNEKDARKYVKDNHPRPASDSSGQIFTAQLNHPGGAVQTFHTDTDENDGWSKLDEEEDGESVSAEGNSLSVTGLGDGSSEYVPPTYTPPVV